MKGGEKQEDKEAPCINTMCSTSKDQSGTSSVQTK